jgi:hypothetical protein
LRQSKQRRLIWQEDLNPKQLKFDHHRKRKYIEVFGFVSSAEGIRKAGRSIRSRFAMIASAMMFRTPAECAVVLQSRKR